MPVWYPDARVTLQVVLESYKDDNRPFAFPVRPTSITLFRNSYKEADTWSTTFNATELPMTPELIRGGATEIFLFPKRSVDEEPRTVTKGEDTDLYIEGDEIRPSMVGLFDEADLVYSEDGRWLTINGRDYTGLYLDIDWDARRRLPYKGRLDSVIQDLIDEVPGSNGIIKVKVDPPELAAELPIVGRTETRSNRRGLVFPNKANYWEVVLNLAVRYGFITFVKGTDIILTKPHSYIEGRTGSLSMAWGNNISELRMTRKLGKERVPVIECRSYDPRTQKVLKGQYPSKKQSKAQLVQDKKDKKAKSRAKKPPRKAGENANGLGTIKEEVRQFVIPGITSEKQLAEVARQTYNQLGRSELTVQLETLDLEDLDGKQIMDISSGDAMQVKFQPFNNDIVNDMIGRRLQRKIGLEVDGNTGRIYFDTFPKEAAEAIMRLTEELNELKKPLRIDEATIDWDKDEGVQITAKMRNFVNVTIAEEAA